MKHRTMLATVAITLALLPGCAQYQYQIVEPAEFAQSISRKQSTEFALEPLRYRMREIDRRLAVRIDNPNDEPITILGERSYVVDPNGETHPLRGGTIAPASFITFDLPPAPRFYRSGPRFGFGIGVGTSFYVRQYYGHYHHHHFDDMYFGSRYSHPVFYGADHDYWRWTTGIVRMRLAGESTGGPFEHHLVIDRVRVK